MIWLPSKRRIDRKLQEEKDAIARERAELANERASLEKAKADITKQKEDLATSNWLAAQIYELLSWSWRRQEDYTGAVTKELGKAQGERLASAEVKASK